MLVGESREMGCSEKWCSCCKTTRLLGYHLLQAAGYGDDIGEVPDENREVLVEPDDANDGEELDGGHFIHPGDLSSCNGSTTSSSSSSDERPQASKKLLQMSCERRESRTLNEKRLPLWKCGFNLEIEALGFFKVSLSSF